MNEPTPALLLLDLPPSALCGIDLLSFTTTAGFKGIKSLPPGIHFIFTAPHSTLAVRHGAWFHIPTTTSPPPLILKRWDQSLETLLPVSDPATILHHRANLGQIWRSGLAPYRQRAGDPSVQTAGTSASSSTYPQSLPSLPEGTKASEQEELNSFPALASHITPAYLHNVFSAPQDEWHLTSYSDASDSSEEGVQLPSVPASRPGEVEKPLRLMRIDLRRTWRAGATGRERTEGARDRSWFLFELGRVAGMDGGKGQEGVGLDAVVAELQFCFLMGLTLNNYVCLEQWRRVVRVVLTCRRAVGEVPGFFVRVLRVLRGQVERLGTDTGSGMGEDGVRETAERRQGRAIGEVEATSLEEKTEEELLRYDLPLRGKAGQGGSRKKALEREAKALQKDAEREQERKVVQGMGDDELKTLFLDDEVDASGDSFLRGLLVGFRKVIEEMLSGRDDMEIEGKGSDGDGDTVQDVLEALKSLEATLFDMYGWDFDEAPAVGRAVKSGLPALSSDTPDLEGYGLRGEPDGARKQVMHDEDEEEDEDGEYAPAIVDLTQEQLDALGIQGTPSAKIKPQNSDKRQRDTERNTAVSQVVVEESSDEEAEDGGNTLSEEEYDDTMNIEDLDARY